MVCWEPIRKAETVSTFRSYYWTPRAPRASASWSLFARLPLMFDACDMRHAFSLNLKFVDNRPVHLMHAILYTTN
jgi:hypothetical protein